MLKIDNVFSKRQTNRSYKQTKTNKQRNNATLQLLTFTLLTSTHFYSLLQFIMASQQTSQNQNQNVLRISQEYVSVCPETVKYILGDDWRKPEGIVCRSIQRLYDVKLTVVIDPIRDFNPKDWTGKFYDDPQIVVTGPEATKKNGQYDSWNAVPNIIREIDISICKRRKQEVLGLYQRNQTIIYQGYVECYKTDIKSLHIFHKGFDDIIWFCEDEYNVKIKFHNPNNSKHFNFMIKGECWEEVQKSRWMLKLKEAGLRAVQKFYEQEEDMGLAFAQSFTD